MCILTFEQFSSSIEQFRAVVKKCYISCYDQIVPELLFLHSFEHVFASNFETQKFEMYVRNYLRTSRESCRCNESSSSTVGTNR